MELLVMGRTKDMPLREGVRRVPRGGSGGVLGGCLTRQLRARRPLFKLQNPVLLPQKVFFSPKSSRMTP